MRRITFERNQGSFIVREELEGSSEAYYRCSFENGFRRMSELNQEGFREVRTPMGTPDLKYVWEKWRTGTKIITVFGKWVESFTSTSANVVSQLVVWVCGRVGTWIVSTAVMSIVWMKNTSDCVTRSGIYTRWRELNRLQRKRRTEVVEIAVELQDVLPDATDYQLHDAILDCTGRQLTEVEKQLAVIAYDNDAETAYKSIWW